MHDAFVLRQSTDQQTYGRMRDKPRNDLVLAQMELNEAGLERIDIEEVIGFAEHLLHDASRLWLEAGSAQKSQLQRAFFPEGLNFDGKEFWNRYNEPGFQRVAGIRAGGTKYGVPNGIRVDGQRRSSRGSCRACA